MLRSGWVRLAGVLVLAWGASAFAEEPVVLVDDLYDYSPWTANGLYISNAPTKFDDMVRRSDLISNWTSYELVDFGAEQKQAFSWEGTGGRMLAQIKVNPNHTQVVAAARPVGTFRFEILELVNCTLHISLAAKGLLGQPAGAD